jgi:ATP-dependent DNA helicase RecQ
VDDIFQSEFKGTRAVLVEKNEEALWMVSRLESKGLKTRLITGLDGFKVSQLYEIRAFTSFIKKQLNGLILESDWKLAEDQFREKFNKSHHYDNCISLIRLFDENYQGEKLYQDWLEYSREIRFEDIYSNEESKILVSTIHKVKGKEFDAVWLMHHGLFDERVNYVACSRARNRLRIHTNQSDFDHILDDQFISFDNQRYDPPSVLDFVLTHKDINLSSIKKEEVQSRIENLKTGERLIFSEFQTGFGSAKGLRNVNNQFISAFSKRFYSQTYDVLLKRGYKLVNAKVEYRLNWYDNVSEVTYEVVLPKVRFSKI